MMQPLDLYGVDHWQGFADFARLDRLAGGPDSHMKTVAEMSKDCTLEEKCWRAAIYACGVYNVPTAEVIWSRFPFELAFDLAGQSAWIVKNWSGLGFRRERRAARTPEKLSTTLWTAARWAEAAGRAGWGGRSYEEIWTGAEQIKYAGRYALIKLLETLRLMGVTPEIIPNILPKGGWSPREGLALLRPDSEKLLTQKRDAKEDLKEIVTLGELVRRMIAEQYGVELNTYEFQVFLCDYKQAVAGRQYPGRSLDSEIEYATKVSSHLWDFEYESQLWPTRARIFPAWALGEQQGWGWVRKELGRCFSDYGYMWTDSWFDYHLTKDLKHPVVDIKPLV